MKKSLTAIGIVATLFLTSPGTAAAVASNTIVPISATAFVPCAADGVGEYVALKGNLHVKFSATFDSSGGVHLTESYNPMGVTGIGLSTGTKYQASGETHSVSNSSADGGFNNKFEDIFRIIGPGPGNNLMVHENFHLVVDAQGNVTLFADSLSVQCE